MAYLITPTFRGSFTRDLFKPQKNDAGQDRWSVTAIWTPSKFTKREKALWKALIAELDTQCLATFKKKWSDLPANIKKGIRDGEEKDGYPGFGAGTVFATLSTTQAPKISNIDGDMISQTLGNADDIYPGVYLRAVVETYTYTTVGKGVALGLRKVQKVGDCKDDERFAGGGSDAEADELLANEPIDREWLEAHEAAADDDSDDIPF